MFQIKYNIAAACILIAYLFVGILIYRDYGIGYDDEAQRLIGKVNYDWIHKKNDSLLSFADRFYGPVYEVSLITLERAFGATSGKEIYETRHLANFIHYWISVVIFWLLLTWIYKDSLISIIGIIFLILSPRFFAESFYNTKDLPLMSAYIYSFAALVLTIQKQTFFRIVVFAAVSAYTTAIRPFGLFFPLLYGYYLFLDIFKKKNIRLSLIRTVLYGVTYVTLLFLFWPILLNSPAQFFLMLRESTKQLDQPIYYFGSFISSINKPWHYLPVFITITTPLLVTALSTVGFIAMTYTSFRRKVTESQNFIQIAVLLWLTLPILMLYMVNPRIYDGWRHLYFIYPAIIIIALAPVKKILEVNLNRGRRMILMTLLATILLLHSGAQIWFIIRSHPYQNIYFSLWINNLRTASQLFDFDYWGLSEAEAIRFILINDQRPIITIYFADTPGLIHSQNSNEYASRTGNQTLTISLRSIGGKKLSTFPASPAYIRLLLIMRYYLRYIKII